MAPLGMAPLEIQVGKRAKADFTFKHKKARYKGFKKNDAQMNVLFASSNLYMVRGNVPIVGKTGGNHFK